jgi:glycosyltransferase involved in cell wall biosynthesis
MAPKLLYLVTEDWYFWSHRLPMARAALRDGFEVSVACRVDQHHAMIEAEGIRVIPLAWRRRDNGPFQASRAVAEIARLYRRERPDIIHHIAIKPTVFGGIAATLSGAPAIVNSLTGIGSMFLRRGPSSLAAQKLIRWVLWRKGSWLIVQNEDDRKCLEAAGFVAPDRVTVIRGSGIDIEHFRPLPEPEVSETSAVKAAYVGRMLREKGVPVLIEALRLARGRGAKIELLLVGMPDPENPSSLSLEDLKAWSHEPGITWLGQVSDVRPVWAEAHFGVLPSQQEGLPKSLLEAAACGRALIATDVPGCREIARAGENALLVPPDDVEKLAEAMMRLAQDEALRRSFAAASRRFVQSDLAAGPVGEATVRLYRQALAKHAGNGLRAANTYRYRPE